MSDAGGMSDLLIREFAENYMEKIFYFCLKKTGSNFEAEDLTQDIALNILTALNKGTIPVSFSAWVWQIARNRYSVWADEKHRRNESVTGSDIGDYEIEDESENLSDEAQGEQMSLLRRELAFISRDYREIVVAYYIENRSMREISDRLSLSLETVKKRIQRARKILKEGMNMAREFGVRSYRPEEIFFSNSCSSFGDNGQPWSILSHALYKNIFLEAYGNPSTAEELSLELGVALPYMEDELDYLTKQTFLTKSGNRYETSFPIISKNAQEKIWNYNNKIIEKLTGLLERLVDDFSAACENHGIRYFGNYQKYDDAKWTLLMLTFDRLMADVSQGESFEYTKRPDNGNWDIVGYQNAYIPDLPWVGQHGCLDDSMGRPAVHFQQYKFARYDISRKTPEFIRYEEALTLEAVAEGKIETCEDMLLERLCDYGYIRKTEKGYEPQIIVFEGYDTDKYLKAFSESEKKMISETAGKIRKILSESNDVAYKVTCEDLPAVFRDDKRMCRFACANNKMDRCNVLEQALSDGWIKYDDNTSKVIGAYIYI